ncbi:MAG: hypothetical protein GXO79_05510 [Chlorobi bacterium]|nr:hypothetical protein [Chlorobiota bacterium]
MNSIDYNRLLELKRLIKENKATKKERKEYMTLLYENGNISKEQYDKFLKDQNSDDIIGAALTIGGVVLATWLLSKLFGND